jgi:2-hydroxy-3-keto-5-methylthiopentenyl-1-phosphate phosphatase
MPKSSSVPIVVSQVEHAHLPAPYAAQVWIDFDGTLAGRDVLDDLIRNFSRDDSWKMIEERWQAGLIGSRQCLEQQLALLDLSNEELGNFLDSVPLDPGAVALLKFLEKHDVPAAILSDGVDRFIRRIIRRHGITKLAIRSNTITRKGRSMELHCPHSNANCSSASAHCKCGSAEAIGDASRGTIYIGDGRSDLCASRKADFVFAKNVLARLLDEEGIPYVRYATLADVQHVLSTAWTTKPSVKLAVVAS